MAKKKYADNAIAPIIAFDFDNTINVNGEDKFPECGEVRKYAKEVINFLHSTGCKIVIWTSRDVAYNQDERCMYDHLTPMLNFLNDNSIEYDAINKSIQFAPYHYNGRKVYAHMYVDDRAFGWYEGQWIMLMVLKTILTDIIGIGEHIAILICNSIEYDGNADYLIEYVKEHVDAWRDS